MRTDLEILLDLQYEKTDNGKWQCRLCKQPDVYMDSIGKFVCLHTSSCYVGKVEAKKK